ncbi:MAG: Na+/H+ antiporter NhaA, partial [Fibrobacteres bacterium]|nr:Na+/H+ antiporter NhaA [Fibrobacterota bacterium]
MPTQPIERIARSIRLFTRLEAASGILLLLALAAALAWANSPWAETYFRILEAPLSFGLGSFGIATTPHHVINDALMAVFFFVVGLEIKRETVAGELAGLRRAAFPALAALGGMLVPALIYALCNAGHASLRGWGIPVATDIPFALGIMALLGKRIPGSVKIFLMALAIIDDLGAVLVIAVFYTGRIDWLGLAEAGALVAVLIAFNRAGLRRAWLYAIPGIALWHFLQKAGVHGTIAGVVTAWAIPARSRSDASGIALESPLQRIVEALHPWTSFFILPLFALSNAGVRIGPEVLRGLASPAGIGIVLGLVVGKPLGIFAAVQTMLALGFPKLSGGVNWKHMLGAGML